MLFTGFCTFSSESQKKWCLRVFVILISVFHSLSRWITNLGNSSGPISNQNQIFSTFVIWFHFMFISFKYNAPLCACAPSLCLNLWWAHFWAYWYFHRLQLPGLFLPSLTLHCHFIRRATHWWIHWTGLNKWTSLNIITGFTPQTGLNSCVKNQKNTANTQQLTWRGGDIIQRNISFSWVNKY